MEAVFGGSAAGMVEGKGKWSCGMCKEKEVGTWK